MDFGSPRVDLQVDQLTMLTTGYVEYSMRFTGDFPLGYVKCLDCHILLNIQWIGLREHLHRKPIRFSPKKYFVGKSGSNFWNQSCTDVTRLILRSRPPSTSTRPFCRSSKRSRRKFQGISWEPMIRCFFQKGNPLLGESKKGICIYI